jgi:anaerobic selenocysteine-containing dehydrogenase
MHPEGVGKIWGYGRAEGPLPEVYEPWESPLDVNLMTGVENDSTRKGKPGFNNPACYIGYLEGDNDKGSNTAYPHVGMTYRVSEMWQAGQMTRNHPWLNELQPEVFAELDEDLAADKGISSGDRVRVSTARGYVDAVAIVTKRLQPLTIGSGSSQKTIHQVGVPWHYGYIGLSSAPHSSGNILTPHVGDANTTIPEYKTFLCNIEKV